MLQGLRLRATLDTRFIDEEHIPKLKENIKQRARKFHHYFLILGDRLIPTPKLPFVNYQEATIDFSEPGNISFTSMHAHYQNGRRLRLREAKIGLIDLEKRYDKFMEKAQTSP